MSNRQTQPSSDFAPIYCTLRFVPELTGIAIRFEPDHFVEATLTAGEHVYQCCCLNIVDGISALLNSMMVMRSYERVQTMTKWTYDGQTWWVLDRDGHDLWLNLLEFDEAPVELPSGHWVAVAAFRSIAFSARIGFDDFVVKVVQEFDRVYSELRDSGYRLVWGYEFPRLQLDALRPPANA